MNLNGKTIGFGLTGSHCTYAAVMPQIRGRFDGREANRIAREELGVT